MITNTGLPRTFKKLCVFCGSNTGARPAYEKATLVLGKLLANSGTALVYGGGRVGLMGVLADAVLSPRARQSESCPALWSRKKSRIRD